MQTPPIMRRNNWLLLCIYGKGFSLKLESVWSEEVIGKMEIQSGSVSHRLRRRAFRGTSNGVSGPVFSTSQMVRFRTRIRRRDPCERQVVPPCREQNRMSTRRWTTPAQVQRPATRAGQCVRNFRKVSVCRTAAAAFAVLAGSTRKAKARLAEIRWLASAAAIPGCRHWPRVRGVRPRHDHGWPESRPAVFRGLAADNRLTAEIGLATASTHRQVGEEAVPCRCGHRRQCDGPAQTWSVHPGLRP